MSIFTNYERSREVKEAYELKFTEHDMQGVDTPHNDALLLTIDINTYDIKRILIDPRSSSEIMYHSLYKKLDLPASQVWATDMPIFSFSGEAVWPIAIAEVPVRIGHMKKNIEFIIMNIDSLYNDIFGCGWLG